MDIPLPQTEINRRKKNLPIQVKMNLFFLKFFKIILKSFESFISALEFISYIGAIKQRKVKNYDDHIDFAIEQVTAYKTLNGFMVLIMLLLILYCQFISNVDVPMNVKLSIVFFLLMGGILENRHNIYDSYKYSRDPEHGEKKVLLI